MEWYLKFKDYTLQRQINYVFVVPVDNDIAWLGPICIPLRQVRPSIPIKC